ncbi:MAG TPA: hypothetical protein HPP76_09220 [Desulfuromonadales bacterium]|nr:hypothetical protein [Desulfuromonadales bacterium]
MMLHPAVLALLLTSLLVAAMGLYAGYYGLRILKSWKLESGSELQLELERRTSLISTIMSYDLFIQLMSLFLYVYTADSLHPLFTGAMCAAGVLNINQFGYPLLLLKMLNFLLAGVWLILNYADCRGFDYPLIRVKFELLNLIVPLLLVETCLLAAYFSGVKPDIITSCCGSLFGHEAVGLGGNLTALPQQPMQLAFFSVMSVTFASGVYFYRMGCGGWIFSTAAGAAFLIAGASITSFICLYIYELPTHHCPFCLLQKEYGYIGYIMYATLFGGGVAGLGTGALLPFRSTGSMVRIIPPLQRRLTLITVACYLLFTLITAWKMFSSELRLTF